MTVEHVPGWTDSHCHLPLDVVGHVPFDGVDADVVAQAAAAGVTRLVSVGTDATRSAAAIGVARDHRQVWATVGLHPHEARHGVETILGLLEPADPKVVAVGECGLDYHYDLSERAVQREVFAAQVALSHRHGLALVIHTREAWDDTFDILAAEGVPERTVFHCFTGGEVEAARALAVGAWLSFSGIVTFKNAADVRAAASRCPPTRMLVETDSPYLTPVPHRGTPNRPALVPLVGAALAEIKGVTVEEMAEVTSANATAAFHLAGPGA